MRFLREAGNYRLVLGTLEDLVSQFSRYLSSRDSRGDTDMPPSSFCKGKFTFDENGFQRGGRGMRAGRGDSEVSVFPGGRGTRPLSIGRLRGGGNEERRRRGRKTMEKKEKLDPPRPIP